MELFHSYAKINIGLRIVNKRSDGYHNLESIFQEISLADEIYIKKQENGVTIKCNDPAIPTDHRNLCHKVYTQLMKKFNLDAGVLIELKKNIPYGAGLGGGSSNAATCLNAFNSLFNLKLSSSQLIRVAASIGADVPFFILGRTAVVKGKGEVVIPVSFFADYQILIVFPNLHIATEFVYKNFEMGLTDYRDNIKFEAVINKVNTLEDISSLFSNDLEKVVLKYFPEIGEVKNKLRKSGAEFISLSGSGSSVFALYPKDFDLLKIKELFPPRNKIFIANPIV